MRILHSAKAIITPKRHADLYLLKINDLSGQENLNQKCHAMAAEQGVKNADSHLTDYLCPLGVERNID